MSLHSINRDEMHVIITELKQAVYNHVQWHNALVRTLICKLPVDQHDIAPMAHKKCRFGQWYYSKSSEQLRKHPGFIAIGKEHQRLHKLTTDLLLANGKDTIPVYEYDNFSNTLERLRLEITALERELEDLLYNRDTLTGAMNRVSMLPSLREQQALVQRKMQVCCIVMMDIDKFKDVNDAFGHSIGDKVLIKVAHYLIENLREYDKIFRYGGEEFLICLPNSDLALANKVVERLREGLAELKFDTGAKKTIHVKASFGLTLLDPDTPIEQSLERADKAVYAAKNAGRNCTRIWEEGL